MRKDFRPFLEKADHKDDLDLLTIKVSFKIRITCSRARITKLRYRCIRVVLLQVQIPVRIRRLARQALIHLLWNERSSLKSVLIPVRWRCYEKKSWQIINFYVIHLLRTNCRILRSFELKFCYCSSTTMNSFFVFSSWMIDNIVNENYNHR